MSKRFYDLQVSHIELRDLIRGLELLLDARTNGLGAPESDPELEKLIHYLEVEYE